MAEFKVKTLVNFRVGSGSKFGIIIEVVPTKKFPESKVSSHWSREGESYVIKCIAGMTCGRNYWPRVSAITLDE